MCNFVCKGRPQNDLNCVGWDVELYSLAHFTETESNFKTNFKTPFSTLLDINVIFFLHVKYTGHSLSFACDCAHKVFPEPDISSHCETTDMGLMYHAVCLFTIQLSLVLAVPIHKGMARLS